MEETKTMEEINITEEPILNDVKEKQYVCKKHGVLGPYVITFHFPNGSDKSFCTLCISDLLSANIDEAYLEKVE